VKRLIASLALVLIFSADVGKARADFISLQLNSSNDNNAGWGYATTTGDNYRVGGNYGDAFSSTHISNVYLSQNNGLTFLNSGDGPSTAIDLPTSTIGTFTYQFYYTNAWAHALTLQLWSTSPDLSAPSIVVSTQHDSAPGAFAATADYDLCQVIAFDPRADLRQNALAALDKVQPNLYPIVVTLTLPPEQYPKVVNLTGYVRAIKQMPAFGRAGLPLIAMQMQGMHPYLVNLQPSQAFSLLQAHTDALSRIAAEDGDALQLLLNVAASPLSQRLKTVRGATFVDTFGFYHKFRQDTAKRLSAIGIEKAGKRKAIVPFFIEMLGSGGTDFNAVEDRVSAANTLAAFGPDAKSALPALNNLQLDPSEQVRAAVRYAIAQIGKAG
jgi:hypothetical protein